MEDNYYELRIIQGILMAVVIMCGICGNATVCFIVHRYPKLRTVTNIIIVNLAYSDMGICMFNIPISLSAVIANSWVLGDTMCLVHGFFNSLFLYESLFSLTLISLSRYFCIVQPGRFSFLFTKRKTMSMIAVTWVLSFLCAFPPVIGWSVYHFVLAKAMCVADWNEDLSYSITIATVCFILPFFLITIPYFKIFKFIRAHKQRIKTSLRNLQTSTSHRIKRTAFSTFYDFRVTKLLLVVVCVFLACWVPYVIVSLASSLLKYSSIPRAVEAVVMWLTLLNSSCNPFIYGLMNPQFRKGFKSVLPSIVPGGCSSKCFLSKDGRHHRHTFSSTSISVRRSGKKQVVSTVSLHETHLQEDINYVSTV